MPGGTVYVTLLRSDEMPEVNRVPINPNWGHVNACTTADVANPAAAAPLVVDGVTLIAGDRVGVVFQADATTNGIYRVVTPGTGADGAWVRAQDMEASADLVTGRWFWSMAGALYGRQYWLLSSTGALVLGASPLLFEMASVVLAAAAGPGEQFEVTVLPNQALLLRWLPRVPARIIRIEVFCQSQPASALGTYLLTAAKSTGANLLSAVSYDLESLLALTRTSLGLTATLADRTFTTAQWADFTFTSNNLDLTGSGLMLVITAQPV